MQYDSVREVWMNALFAFILEALVGVLACALTGDLAIGFWLAAATSAALFIAVPLRESGQLPYDCWGAFAEMCGFSAAALLESNLWLAVSLAGAAVVFAGVNAWRIVVLDRFKAGKGPLVFFVSLPLGIGVVFGMLMVLAQEIWANPERFLRPTR